MKERAKILKYLEEIASIIQVPLYWYDVNNAVLGGNDSMVRAIGGKSTGDFIGKTPYDYYPPAVADNIVKSNNEVIRTGKAMSWEEPIEDISTGEVKYFIAYKAPLRDDEGNIIGTIGTSIDITAQKEASRLKMENDLHKVQLQEQEKFKKIIDQVARDIQSTSAILSILVQYFKGMTAQKIFEAIEKFAAAISVPLRWFDPSGVFLGGNQLCLDVTGATSLDVFIGKKYDQVYPKNIAEKIVKNFELVISTGDTVESEEMIKDLATGKERYLTTARAPLYDENNVIIGVIAASIEITDKKEAERLRLETERQKIQLREQDKFKKIIDQVINNSHSPLVVLSLLVQYCADMTAVKAFEQLEMIAQIIPIPFFWFDVSSVVLGGNELVAKALGGKSIKDFIGKTPYEYYPYDIADGIVQANKKILATGKVFSQDESIKDAATGKFKYFSVYKSLLHDNRGNVIGIIGVSIDTTSQKEVEQLRLETELQKAKLQEQDNFRAIASQVVHDIRSPLTSLSIMVNYCESLPESTRIALREAATRIGDIANNLLGKYKQEDTEKRDVNGVEKRQSTVVSLTLLQLLTEKKYQYEGLPVKFVHDFCPDCHFAFINIQPAAFKRAISNLINNAVDALDGKDGEVNLRLNEENGYIKIVIQDRGKGMSPEIVKKIMDNVAVTNGKEDGHGLGLMQVRETLQNNQGKLAIESQVDGGTKMTLTFPKAAPAEWMVKRISLNKGDIVIILDDDTSIHEAWKMRFKPYKHDIRLVHFQMGDDAIACINASPTKDKIFLLADYELLKQELSGLHVIERTNIQRSILVTSHYANQVVRNLAAKTGTKILPKQLASEVIITVGDVNENDENSINDNVNDNKADDHKKNDVTEESEKGRKDGEHQVECKTEAANCGSGLSNVDLVIIDDNRAFLSSFAHLLTMRGKVVDTYCHPQRFLENVSRYAKDTKICMDNDLGCRITGIQLAKQLYEAGFTRLYLLSGWDFEKGEVPDYLTVIVKGVDVDSIVKALI